MYSFITFIKFYSTDFYFLNGIKNYLYYSYRAILLLLCIYNILITNSLELFLDNFSMNYLNILLIDSGFVNMDPGINPGGGPYGPPNGGPGGGPYGPPSGGPGGPPGGPPYNSSILPAHDYLAHRDRYSLFTEPGKESYQETSFTENGIQYTYYYDKKFHILQEVHIRLPDKTLLIHKDEKRVYEFIRFHNYLINKDNQFLDNYLDKLGATWKEHLARNVTRPKPWVRYWSR